MSRFDSSGTTFAQYIYEIHLGGFMKFNGLIILAAALLSACSQPLSFNSIPVPVNTPLAVGDRKATDVFASQGTSGKVDMLFMDDNSGSMDPLQNQLAAKFSALSESMVGIDWQAGIVTSDCTSGDPYNFCGQLLNFTGMPAGASPAPYILTPKVPSFETIFQNTIVRPETANCWATNSCPSGDEQGLLSISTAFSNRNTKNAGFFRNNSDLAVVILSNEDERSNAPPSATTPAQVLNAFKAAFGNTKRITVYSIIILPTDAACIAQQASIGGVPATYAAALATQTGGLGLSICAPDYSMTLTDIAESVITLTKTLDLSNTPVADSIEVNFEPAFSTTWTVSGNRLTLATPAPLGTKISVSYKY